MNRESPLRGGCSCGRNKYTIIIPQDTNEVARVIFSNSHQHRKSHATPLSAFLRIPLTWYSSTTESYLPDETSASIRRTYTSPNEQSSIRHFCGFCGTPLAYWTEEPVEEKEFICLTVGSLRGEDLRDLEDWGVLPKEGEGVNETEAERVEDGDGEGDEGLPWFQSLVEGSRLGNMRRSLGRRRSRDGRVTVEWEIIEWTEGDGDEGEGEILRPVANGKRKLGDVEDEDKRMSGTA